MKVWHVLSWLLSPTLGNPRFQLFGKYYYRLRTNDKVVALTFDDGPLEPYTRELLEVLGRHQVQATFFFVGKKIEMAPDLARLVYSKGHELGNHSYSHPHLIFKSFSFIRKEILKTDNLLREIVAPGEVIHFRSPYGQKFIGVPYVLNQLKNKNILFDFFSDPPDWESTDSQRIAESIINRSRPGSILVLHDGNRNAGPQVAKTTDLVIQGLRQKGYRFETIKQLLERHG